MQNVYSVGQINTYIKNMFAQDFVLNRIRVRGEVSNCKYHSSGHIYFSLKDASGTIACVMFAGARKGLAFRMSDGQQVVVYGKVDVYERDGKYQLYASQIQQDGAGLLYEKFLALKAELEEMGMFDPSYKQPVPAYVKTLGVVTAPTGAAVRDIIQISKRRNPGIRIILYPAKVQGEGAAQSVAQGIAALDAAGVDVIIAGRGGGSIEDLWAFNEEAVARAIFNCRTPVISAVGHETDTTIADFAADLRAPTPSAAAELAVKDMQQIVDHILTTRTRLQYLIESNIQDKRTLLEHFTERIKYLTPMHRILEQRQRTADLETRFQNAIQMQINDRKYKMSVYIERMRGASPLEKLAQGYSVVLGSGKERIYSVDQIKEDEMIEIYVSDGKIDAKVERKAVWQKE